MSAFRKLKKGDVSYEVSMLQKQLNLRGCDCGSPDSIFGPNTEAAVIKFQKEGMKYIAGEVCENTWDALMGSPRPLEEVLATGSLNGKKILLDPGHSERFVGARGTTPDYPQEEDFTRLMASELKKHLTALGVQVDITDPAEDELGVIGAKAAGYNMFISLHLNAAKRVDYYTCVMIHRSKAKAGSKKFAKACADSLAKALNHKQSQASDVPGVYPAGLAVLSAAENTNCPVCVLTEAFFIDAYGSNEIVKQRCLVASKAIANAVIAWFS